MLLNSLELDLLNTEQNCLLIPLSKPLSQADAGQLTEISA